MNNPYLIREEPPKSIQEKYTAPAAPFNATKTDGAYALCCLVFGFLFVRWVLLEMIEGYTVTMFTTLFSGATLAYFLAKKIRPKRESWLWFSLLQLVSLSYSFWPGMGLSLVRFVFLFALAIYWCLSAAGALCEESTGNLLLLDGLNAAILVPFGNFGLLFRSLGALRVRVKREKLSRLLHIGLGLLALLVLFAFLFPLLAEADGGSFGLLTNSLSAFIRNIIKSIPDDLSTIFFQFLFGIPVAMYICGLAAGLAHKRKTHNIRPKAVRVNLARVRAIPRITAFISLGGVSLLYLVFLACQLGYFFSAFGGSLPEGYVNYADFARKGFFELCTISVINLFLLVFTNNFVLKQERVSEPIKGLNILLSSLTLVLIATAFRKMGLYIDAYGLTPKRVLTSVFMVFLFVVFSGLIVLQFKPFVIMRFSLIFGSVLLCLLCCVNINGIISQYNAARYLAGTLPQYDVEILYQCGVAGIPGAVKAADESNRQEIGQAIIHTYNSHTYSKVGTIIEGYVAGRYITTEKNPETNREQTAVNWPS